MFNRFKYMKKIFIILFTLFVNQLCSQKIYSVDYSYQADFKVFVVEYPYQADLKIYKVDYDYKVKRGYGINNKSDGIMYKNLLASYTHIRDTQNSRWIKNFLSFVEDSKIKE